MWAWELSTQVYGLPPERVWVSVYEEDEESLAIWRDEVGVDPARIRKMGAADNFWASGPTGEAQTMAAAAAAVAAAWHACMTRCMHALRVPACSRHHTTRQRAALLVHAPAATRAGPCGPCSELYYDFHPEAGAGLEVSLEDDTRFIEFYNLVFMELNRDAAGTLTPLAAKNIDTGMGLERMTQILQVRACGRGGLVAAHKGAGAAHTRQRTR